MAALFKTICSILCAIMLLAGCAKPAQKIVYRFPEFQEVSYVADDRIVRAVRQLIADYQSWIDQHPTDDVKDAALGEYVRLHNLLVKECSLYGVTIPVRTLKQITSSHDYLASMQPLRDYLRKKGWEAGFYAPMMFSGKETSRMGGLVWMGEIRFRRTSAVTRYDGKKVNFTEEILLNPVQTRMTIMHFNSITEGTHIIHFLQEFEKTADNIAKICENDNPDGMSYEDIFTVAEWKQLSDELEVPILKAHIVAGLLSAASQHEQQHVRDQEVMQVINTDKYDMGAQAKLKALIEARGLMASVANSNVPLYAYAHIMNWYGSHDVNFRAAGEIAFATFGRPKLVDKDNPSVSMRLQGKKKLAELDKAYAEVTERMKTEDKDPIASAIRDNKI
jgi:hypothetical protein